MSDRKQVTVGFVLRQPFPHLWSQSSLGRKFLPEKPPHGNHTSCDSKATVAGSAASRLRQHRRQVNPALQPQECTSSRPAVGFPSSSFRRKKRGGNILFGEKKPYHKTEKKKKNKNKKKKKENTFAAGLRSLAPVPASLRHFPRNLTTLTSSAQLTPASPSRKPIPMDGIAAHLAASMK